MQKQKYILVMLTTIIALLSTAVSGQTVKADNNFAGLINDGSRVRWEIRVLYSSLTLTISAPNGESYRMEFPAGISPSFEINDKQGLLPNGSYTFEITLTPILSGEVKDALTNARKNGNESEVTKELASRGLLPNPMAQSGTFSIQNGMVITASSSKEPENPRATSSKTTGNKPVPEDVVTPDDAIIQGSLCVGFDCVNNEDFGFDTIRLKENNLRIKFEDTSNSAQFPTNDWQLTANDTTNGGANRFSIDDIDNARTPFTILAGAPTNSLFINSNGKIGFRTATPVLDFHLITGDTPAFRFEQNGSVGFSPQTWDVAGNEANFFIRDVTNGSRLPFRIRPGAPTSSIDIGSDGVVTFQNGIRFFDSSTNTFTTVQSAPVGGDSGSSLHIIGSSGTPDDDSLSLYETIGSGVSVKSGSTGVVTMRYNIPVTGNLLSNASQSVIKIRFRDSDGSGSLSRVQIITHATNIDDGTDSPYTIFDSNTQASTGGSFATRTLCFPAGAISFSTTGRWFEVVITKNDTSVQADFAQIQIYLASSCPP